MAQEIAFENDQSGAQSRAKGSDGRLNVSARADSRGYYNSRDDELSFSFVYSHPASANGQYSFYFKNTSNTKEFVVSAIGINSDLGADVKLWRVSGTAANGVAATPCNMHLSSSISADATAIEDGAGTAISGLTQVCLLDYLKIPVQGHNEFRLDDRLRLSQNEAIALEVDLVTSGTPLVFGVVFGYYE